jgi:hypothetical protein
MSYLIFSTQAVFSRNENALSNLLLDVEAEHPRGSFMN